MTAPQLFFYAFGALAVLSALGMILNVRNTVAAAMSMVLTMISLGVIYVLLDAYLVAALQIMVYAGAIVVVFVFVVMLLNLRRDAFPAERQRVTKLLGVALALGVLAVFLRRMPAVLPTARELPADFGGYRMLGRALFLEYPLAFEVTSLLLLAAIVGAVVLAKRRLD